MAQPQGFIDPKFPSHVCQLNKALYDLKQTPRAWYDKLKVTLLKWGFQNNKADSFLFFLKQVNKVLFILVYMDDVLVTSNKLEHLQEYINKLQQLFSLKNLGPLHYFLGVQIHRTSEGLFLNQSQFISNLLTRFNMQNSSSSPTPIAIGNHLSKNSGELLENPSQDCNALGVLQYLK